MTQKRPPIPAELARRVLIEAGHRCAIHTCRYPQVHIHHIVPWEQCQIHEYENLIALCPNCHARADRGEIDRKSLRLYKLNLRRFWDRFTDDQIGLLVEFAERLNIESPPPHTSQHPTFQRPFITQFYLRDLSANFTDYEIDLLSELAKRPAVDSPDHSAQHPIFQRLLIKRLVDANYVELREPPPGVLSKFGGDIKFDLMRITDQGRRYVEALQRVG